MMQKVVNVLRGWYPTSVLPEPEFATKLAKVEAQEALRLRVEEQSAEIAQIVSEAKMERGSIHPISRKRVLLPFKGKGISA